MQHIGRADVEFYESRLVLLVAREISTKPYDQLSHRSRQRVLNKAVAAVHALLNDQEAMDRLQTRTKTA